MGTRRILEWFLFLSLLATFLARQQLHIQDSATLVRNVMKLGKRVFSNVWLLEVKIGRGNIPNW